jgi:cell division septum initiation protein DivIVA
VVAEGRVESVLRRENRENDLQAAEAADRAGAIVTEQIRSIIGEAEASAEEIRRNAEIEAEGIRQRAAESASRLLQRINAINGPLAALAAELQRELDGAPAEPEALDRRA